MIKILEKEMEDITKKSPDFEDPINSTSTRYWVLKLKPDANEELQIAALAHDIERAVPRDFIKFESYEKHKEYHSKRSAEIISELMKRHGFKQKSIEKVKGLVILHEVGGNEEADILRDADSLSFFEHNIYYYYKNHDKERTKFKINYMYSRCSQKAKNLIKKMRFSDKKIEKIVKEIVK